MRRIFQNSTALAVCLSIGLPQIAAAETILAAADAARLGPVRAGNMPGLADELRDELNAGLRPRQLTCATGESRPCADKTAFLTPGGIAVQLADDGKIILAPGAQQIRKAGAGKAAKAQDGDPTGSRKDKGIRLAQAEGAGDVPVIPPDSVPAQPEPEAAAAAEAAASESKPDARAEERKKKDKDRAEKAEAKDKDKKAEKAEKAKGKAEDRAQADAQAEEPEAPAPSDADIAKALAEREAAQPQAAEAAPAAQAEAPAVVPAPTPAQPDRRGPAKAAKDQAEAAPEIPTVAPAPPDRADTPLAPAVDEQDGPAAAAPRPAKDRAEKAVVPDASPSDADIAKALAEREAADIPAADAGQPEAQPADTVLPKDVPEEAGGSVAGAGKTPADDTVMPALDGSAAPSADDLAAALAASQAIPEASAPETAAAREAAQEASAAPVAALVEENAPVVESETTKVTSENSRSATEDFATDIKGAVRSGADIPVVGGQAGQERAGQGPVTVTPAPADGVQQAAEDDRDESRSRDRTDDLLGIALPALAGLIAGQMLSNNRQVTLNTGDRVVVTRPDGSQEIIKDDNALLQRPGSTVQTQEFADGSSRTVVTREDGSQVVTIRDRDLRVLRRTLVNADGTTTALIDDTTQVEPVVVSQLPPPAQPIAVTPGQQLSESELREALRREVEVNRTFTLGQIRNIPEVRALVAPIDIQAITFETGSAAINPDQAQTLATLGRVISEFVRSNPREIFLIEGHTDSVGSDAANLALSDRRAESVALALTEFFDVPPENMVVQGYGEQFLKVPAEGDVRANRRASVRRITELLARN